MKFFIIANQRSGTHFLATLLDSHNHLRCYDELGRRGTTLNLEKKKVKELADNEGCIVMYNQLPDGESKKKIESSKVLHLVRDLRNTAKSCKVLQIRKELGLPAHSTKPIKIPPIETDEKLIKDMEEAITRRRDGFEQKYNCKDLMIVEYEKLGDDEYHDRILKFLGVQKQNLTSELVKTNFYKAI